ncbi:PqqD family protein, partial [Micromonospora zhanjiangensis]
MTRTPIPRPTLLPGLTRLWRDRHTLQLGLDPERAVLLEITDPGAARLLELLDGAHSETAILRHAGTLDVPRADVRALIDTLRAAGLVLPGPALTPYGLVESARRRLAA